MMKILYTFIIKFNRDVTSMSRINLSRYWPHISS